MKSTRPIVFLCLGLAALHAGRVDDRLEQLGEAWSFHTADGGVRAKLSGTLELEGYYAPDPVADLIHTGSEWYFNPRWRLYLDAQAGRRVYFFAQVRADRGFDPANAPLEVRLDEYALRVNLWSPGRLNVQVGKFATAVGNWVARHDAWNNPFITAPLPYENRTGVWDLKPAPSSAKLLEWAHVRPADPGDKVLLDQALRLPVIWGPVYAPGLALSGSWGRFDYAAELKTAGLSSRPYEWEDAGFKWGRPALGARVGYRPDVRWDVGVSFSEGEYLKEAAAAFIPVGLNRHDYRQQVIAQDLRFAWHHFQFWAEAYAARFAIPRVADVRTFAYYLEAKYRFTPQFSGALRWNQQLFDEVKDLGGQNVAWGRQVWRLDVAPAYRFSAHTQVKLQYSLRHENPSPERFTHSLSAQLMFRF